MGAVALVSRRRGTLLLDNAAPDSRAERDQVPGSAGDGWGPGGSPEARGHPNASRAEGEGWSVGLRWGARGGMEASSRSGRCARPQRSSGQTGSLALAVREGDRLYLGECV